MWQPATSIVSGATARTRKTHICQDYIRRRLWVLLGIRDPIFTDDRRQRINFQPGAERDNVRNPAASRRAATIDANDQLRGRLIGDRFAPPANLRARNWHGVIRREEPTVPYRVCAGLINLHKIAIIKLVSVDTIYCFGIVSIRPSNNFPTTCRQSFRCWLIELLPFHKLRKFGGMTTLRQQMFDMQCIPG